jgi:hypothetical protein
MYNAGQMKTVLYSLTLLGNQIIDQHRTVAICTSPEIATQIIEKNGGRFNEAGAYPFAVIEEVVADVAYPQLVHGVPTWKSLWFHYSVERELYVPCLTPTQFQGICGFGVG